MALGLSIGLTGLRSSGIKAPLGLQGLLNLLWGAETEVANLLGNYGALMRGRKLGSELSLEATGLLWVEVANLFRDVNGGGDGLVMALLRTLLCDTSSTTDLNGELLTLGVTNKLARLLLNIPGSAGALKQCAAFLRTLTIANFLQGPIALFHTLIKCLLLESNLATFLKVLLTKLFLSWFKLCDVGVVAFLHTLVGAFQDGITLE